jgi:hypothetical protein
MVEFLEAERREGHGDVVDDELFRAGLWTPDVVFELGVDGHELFAEESEFLKLELLTLESFVVLVDKTFVDGRVELCCCCCCGSLCSVESVGTD